MLASVLGNYKPALPAPFVLSSQACSRRRRDLFARVSVRLSTPDSSAAINLEVPFERIWGGEYIAPYRFHLFDCDISHTLK